MMEAGMLSETAIRETLRQIIDPELGVNIVDLGLVRAIAVAADAVRVEMTMTSPACPLRDYLEDQVRAAIEGCAPETRNVDVVFVTDPPWSPEMMSDAAREQLGDPR
jgi:metal-sulfur cluster biosynthetic enzyme